jgi:hypothetical protein
MKKSLPLQQKVPHKNKGEENNVLKCKAIPVTGCGGPWDIVRH